MIKRVRCGIDLFWERNINNPFSIGRNMREPIIVFIKSDLLRIASIWFHSPYFHCACSHRIKIDPFSIRRVFRTIVESSQVGKPCFFFCCHIHCPDIVLVVSLTGKDHILSVRRPAMKIGMTRIGTRNLYRLISTRYRQSENSGCIL